MKVKWIPTLAVLFGAQVALAVALELRADRLTPVQPDTVLVATDLGNADHLRIDGPVGPDQPASGAARTGAHIELVKHGGRWTLPGHFDAPADAAKVETLLKTLHTLHRGFPIATTADAADRFAVGAHHYERRLVAQAGSTTLTTVYLGNSPGLRKADARVADDHGVYAVDLATYEVPTGADAWLDTGLLDHDTAQLAEIDVTVPGKPTLELQRSGTSWQAKGLAPDQQLAASQATALVSAIGDVKVDALLGEQPKPAWHQDQPALVLVMKDQAGKSVTWTLLKQDKTEEVVLKASDHPWYLALQPINAQPLLAAAAPDKLVVAAAPAPAPAGAASSAGAAVRQAQR
jgi:hypothetical protein